jgi:hypothetical protein
MPIGLVLITSAFRKNGKKIWLLPGVVLVLGGAAFLYYSGHFKAVPWVHEMLNTKEPVDKADDF